jgi:predicted RNA-binding Zn-ribbon protein involved in translation (DUF1610 family)
MDTMTTPSTRYCALVGCGARFTVEPGVWAILCPEHATPQPEQQIARCLGCRRVVSPMQFRCDDCDPLDDAEKLALSQEQALRDADHYRRYGH